MTESPDRRHPLRLIVNKESQLRILWLVGGGVFLCMALGLAIQCWVGQWVWTIALTLVVGSITSLWISRKIAGPLYRIEKDLERLLNNAYNGTPIRLRPDDPLQHLAELINALIDRMKTLTPRT